MTRMHTAGCKSNSVHSCHWPLVNDTNARWGLSREGQSSFLREWSMTRMHIGQWHECRLVNDTNAHWSMTWKHIGQWHKCTLMGLNQTQCIRVIDRWSMTPMHDGASRERDNHPSLGSGQWHECTLVNDTNADWSMTRMHIGQWHESTLVNDTNAHWWV